MQPLEKQLWQLKPGTFFICKPENTIFYKINDPPNTNYTNILIVDQVSANNVLDKNFIFTPPKPSQLPKYSLVLPVYLTINFFMNDEW